MSAPALKSLLARPVLSDNLRDLDALCQGWYTAEPCLATFVLRGVFADLVARDWLDQQGVPTAVYQPFHDGVLPHLIRIADILSATPAAEPIAELDALVVAYRDSISATP